MHLGKGFLTGINYWPANKAMYWWQGFDPSEVKTDFKKLADNNFQVVRIFLTWEDFQPSPDRISQKALEHLQTVADIALLANLGLMPTFFCGHMSGVNWIPKWMLGSSQSSARFPVYSQNRLEYCGIRNFYLDKELLAAQQYQIQQIAKILQGHGAIVAYDLGNESSNCVVPPHRSLARQWLETMTTTIRSTHPGIPVTLGMHAEDLEEDRNLWPQDAALYCDFLSMHAYPFYLSWVENQCDYELVTFLSIITQWLGEKLVLMQEFGTPTFSLLSHSAEDRNRDLQCALWSETESEFYYKNVLRRLQEEEIQGAMAWCFADYDPSLWERPPLKANLHERYFGMFRYDGSPKKAVSAFKDLEILNHLPNPRQMMWQPQCINRNDFYQNPSKNLKRLFAEYKQHLKVQD